MFKQMGLLRANNNVNQSNMVVAMETWRHCWLTVNVQAVVTNSFLPHECRVRRLTAQRRSVIFPLHGDTDSVGNTHSLAVLLLRDHTWTKREGWKEIEGFIEVSLPKFEQCSHFCQTLFAYLSFKGLHARSGYFKKHEFDTLSNIPHTHWFHNHRTGSIIPVRLLSFNLMMKNKKTRGEWRAEKW